NRLQRCTDNVILINTARDPDDRSSCILIPVGSTESGKRRDNITSVGVFFFLCHILRIHRRVDQPHLIAQPLHCRSGDKDRAFQGVVHFPIQPPRDRRDKSVFREHRLFSCIHQKETSCPICILCLSC